MHNRLRNLDSGAIEQILRYFGFILKSQEGSHQRWVKGGYQVSLIANQKSFTRRTLGSMIRQSGYSEEDWVKALDEI